MADANNVSPLLDEFSLGSPYSSHNGIICCPAIHAVTKEKFILKQISIPESQTQVNAMLLTGACADKAAAQRYYADITQGLVEEIHLLERLAQTRGFAAFFSHQTTPKEGDETGMDLWVLSPYRTTLTAYAKRNAMTHLNAVNLGIDLCAALTLCRKAGYLYQNLKPENIFVTPQRQFQVGDFGFLPLDHLTYATFPAKYRSPFAAPELFDDFGEMNGTIDLYALGMVLYLVYNGGQGPFAESQDGAEARRLKGDPLPPPAYADYEMAAIILKATAFHPADRWQSPEAMGQALVSYMQRNSVNDSVIAAPIVTTPTLDAEADALDAQAEPEAQPDGSTEPEPAPDSPAQSETPESQSVSDPETPPVQKEEEDAPKDEDTPEDEDADGILLQEEEPEPHAAMEDSELADILSRAETFLAPASEEDSTPAPASPAQEDPAPVSPQTPEAAEEEAPEEPGRRRSFKGLIVFLSVLLVLAVLTVGAYYYYIHYYCLPIEQLEVVNGTLNSFQVHLTTDADPSLLRVSCQDTYGNTYGAPLTDGAATFTGLNPNTQYTLTVTVEGFHKLTGAIRTTYTTGAETKILNFTGVTGPEDGSVILSFTSDGPKPESWTLTYQAEGEAPQTRSFSGQNVTVPGLTVGKTYTFQLTAGEGYYLTGNSLTYTVSPAVVAQNLRVTGHTGSAMTLAWDQPETPVTGWTVRCYNSSGFDQSVTVTGYSATIEGVSTDSAYTVEVTAAGMSQNAWIAITANPISITDCAIQADDLNQISLAWIPGSHAPAGGWILLYTYGAGEENTEALQTVESAAVISTVLPNTTYTFSIQAADGTTVLNGVHTVTTPEAPAFSQYGLDASQVFMAAFPTPEDPDWATRDVEPDQQTTQFAPSSSIAFVLEATQGIGRSDEEVETLILVRDAQGIPVDYYIGSAQWHTMWTNDKYLGQLERTPQIPGDYQLEVYFNRQLVHSMTFTITQ